jgi:hypothetical protein
MPQSIDDARDEVREARTEMTSTIEQIDANVSARAQALKARTDIRRIVTEHPWPALGIAFGAGLLLSATGADEKAASAAVTVAKRATTATRDAATRGATAVREKFRSRGRGDTLADSTERREADIAQVKPSLGTRLAEVATAPVISLLDRVLDDMRVAAGDLGARWASRAAQSMGSAAAPSSVAGPPVASSVVSEPEPANDAVPVPPEMLPVEVEARAEAVENS